MVPENQHNAKLKCLVTGATGYLGSHLVNHLESLGHQVIASDLDSGNPNGFRHYITLDIVDKQSFSRLPENLDYIFFFSGMTGTHASFERYEEYVSVNLLGLIHLLDHLRKFPAQPKVVFPSTRLVYRGAKEPLPEDAPKDAKTVYAASKIAAEYMLLAYSNRWQVPWTVFRICVPYGQLSGKGYSYGTVGFFLQKAIEGKDISLYGNGSSTRTFTHVSDICRQITAVSLDGASNHQVYNVAGESFSLLEAATILADQFGVQVVNQPWPDKDLLLESGDTSFNGGKIRQIIADPMMWNFRDWVVSEASRNNKFPSQTHPPAR